MAAICERLVTICHQLMCASKKPSYDEGVHAGVTESDNNINIHVTSSNKYGMLHRADIIQQHSRRKPSYDEGVRALFLLS